VKLHIACGELAGDATYGEDGIMGFRCVECRFGKANRTKWPDPICMQLPVMESLPPELDIVGCEITTSYGTGGIVTAVTGPYSPDPDWFARPRMGGYSIVYEDQCWINEVYVENGRIYTGPCKPPDAACPGRDEVVVVGRVRSVQKSLF